MIKEAAAVVCRAEHLAPSERRQVLDMLGLLDDTGHALAPEPTAEQLRIAAWMPADINLGGEPSGVGRVQRKFATMFEPPYRMGQCESTPPGLRLTPAERDKLNGPPPAPKAKPARPPRVRSNRSPGRQVGEGRSPDLLPPTVDEACGSLTGRNHHAARGESMCDDCRDYYNAYQANVRERRRAGQPKRQRPRPPCGSPHGRKGHRIRGEEVCDACLEASRKYNREAFHKAQERKRAAAAAEQQEQAQAQAS